MRLSATLAIVLGVAASLGGPRRGATQTPATPPAASQNPSPMVERTRAHGRVAPRPLAGVRRSFAGPLGKPVDVFVPSGTRRAGALRLVVHFHGDPFVPEDAVARLGGQHVAAVVTLGAGSGVYDRTFSDPAAYDSLLAGIGREVTAAIGAPARFARVTLVGFSAGHGAIRAILRDSAHFAAVDGVLLLDGMHTSYVPDGTVVEKGGTLDERPLDAFVRFARAAVRGDKRFVVTHSEIFPGTFASTTETADHLLIALGLRRTPVLRWGPNGMQQLSEVRAGRFTLLGFAGNSAPDHVDHLQGMAVFLKMVEDR
jgi:hypothetical protein